MNKKDINNLSEKNLEAAISPVEGEPETSFDMVNKYGRCEIQPTCETQNEWPAIAQGVPKNYKKPTVKKNIDGERIAIQSETDID